MSDFAAFFRLEGTLSSRPTMAAAAWLAGNSQMMGERLARLGNVALAAPFLFGGPLRDPTLASRMAWMGLRDMSEDRLAVLGEEYAQDFVIPKLREAGRELLDRARKDARRVVLISDNLDVIAAPVAAHLGVDEWVSNRMEMRSGKCTGRLESPVVGGHMAGQWVRTFALEHGIDLSGSTAYGSEQDDGMLLSATGLPCAVHPDRQLRRMARDLDWPVVEG